MTNTQGALSGLRVIDMTKFIAAPFGAMHLADMGADVIKVEAPPKGDPNRYRDDNSGLSSGFRAVNRNKRSIMLDLTTEAGHDVLSRLLSTADVMIVTMRPASRTKLKIAYDQLRERYPKLIYVSVTGFGEDAADKHSFDTTAIAMSGLLRQLSIDTSKPLRMSTFLADQLTGLYVAYGVLCALQARHRTGRGQYLSTSLLRATIGFSTVSFYHFFDKNRADQEKTPDGKTRFRSAAFFGTASDGLDLAMHVPPSPAFYWGAFASALGRQDLTADPRFRSRTARDKNYEELDAIVREIIATRPRDEWLEVMDTHEIACAPVCDTSEVFTEPVAQALGLLTRVPNADNPDELTIGPAVGFSETPGQIRHSAPRLGENTAEILAELGYSVDEAAELVLTLNQSSQ